MRYSELQNTGIKISTVCLGTMTFGEQNTEADGHKQMSYALDQGVNFFDTAEIYSVPVRAETYGETERIIGNWFKKTGSRSKIVLASKIAGKNESNKHIRETGFSKEAIKEALEGSLKRLQTDYIDLYQLHWPLRDTNKFGIRVFPYNENEEVEDFQDVLETLNQFIIQGKIRYIGVSNETPWGVMKYLTESSKHHLPRIMTIQNPYSLLNRTFEQGLSEIAKHENVKLLAYSPLGFGMLTGKYRNGQTPKNARLTLFPRLSRYSSTQTFAATEAYYQLAEKHGLSLTQMSLAFVSSRPFVTSTIVGATSLDQLKENIAIADITLPEAVINGINAIHNAIPDPAT